MVKAATPSLAQTAAEEIWQEIDLADCYNGDCPLLDVTEESKLTCLATSPKRCPTTRKRLWALKKSIVSYYISPSATARLIGE